MEGGERVVRDVIKSLFNGVCAGFGFFSVCIEIDLGLGLAFKRHMNGV